MRERRDGSHTDRSLLGMFMELFQLTTLQVGPGNPILLLRKKLRFREVL